MNALEGFGLGLLVAAVVVMALCFLAVRFDGSAEPLDLDAADAERHSREGGHI